MENIRELLALVDRCVSHSHIMANRVLVSTLPIKLPIKGGINYLTKIERRVVTEIGQPAHVETEAASQIMMRELKYLLDSATLHGEPIYQENEDGEEVHIGNSMLVIDRARLKPPSLVIENHGTFLDCIKEE